MEQKTYRIIIRIGYVIVFIVSSLPLACSYIMESGDILMWIARIEELAEQLKAQKLIIFPTMELVQQYNGQYVALNSNLWLLIPAVLQILGGSIVFAYRIYMLIINFIALIAVKKLFEALFENPLISLLGTTLFLTCPYRIYLYYDKIDLGKSVAWALIPLVLLGICKLKERRLKVRDVLVSVLALAGIGYADGILFFIVFVVYLSGIVWYRNIKGGVVLIFGSIIAFPGMYYWLGHLIMGWMDVWNFPVGSIAESRYYIGQLFASWTYQAGHPGFGLGILSALFIGLLARIMFGIDEKKQYSYWTFLGMLMTFLALSSFPWDLLQRIALPLLRLVALIETPGIFISIASLANCVLGARGIEKVLENGDNMMKISVGGIVVLAALGNATYICNTLTYYRMPIWTLG